MKKNINIKKQKNSSVFSAVAITAGILAFIPSVFVKRENGFDAYAILSKLSYRTSIDDEGKKRTDISINLFDLDRYGVEIGNDADDAEEAEKSIEITEATEEENEDSSCIEE